MATIRCPECDCFINSFQLKENNCWSCGNDISILKPDSKNDETNQKSLEKIEEIGTQNLENEEVLKDEKKPGLILKKKIKNMIKEDLDFEEKEMIEPDKEKQYPAIMFLSKLSIILAYGGVIVAVIVYIIILGTARNIDVDEIMMGIFGSLGTFIYFIYWKAISELLIIIVDIAQDLRKLRLNK